MRNLIRRARPSAAMIVAVIALVAAVGGTAVGLPGKKSVDKNDLKKNVVKSKIIKDGQVKTADIGAGEVNSGDIGNGEVGAGDIANGVLQPRAFATVNSDGTVVASNSEGVSTSNVQVVSAGTLYCFNGLGFQPKIVLANVVWAGGGNSDVRTAAGPLDDVGSCPGVEQASARTTDSSTGGQTVVTRIFIAFYD